MQRECPRCGEPLHAARTYCRFCGGLYPWVPLRESDGPRPETSWADLAEALVAKGPRHPAYWLVVGADITELAIESIVAADDASGSMVGSVAYAIRQIGGQQIEDESRVKATGRLGTAWVTGAGQLSVEKVIHAAILDRRRRTSQGMVESASGAVLARACEEGLSELALPMLGAGMQRLSSEEAGHAVGVGVSGHFRDAHDCSVQDIVFVVFEPDQAPGFRRGLLAVLAEE